MTPEEHKERHIKLHNNLDELIVDFVTQAERPLRKTSILELI